MTTFRWSLIIAAWLAICPRARSEHPPIILRDHEGRNVLESSGPVSTMRSCSHCHNTEYIATHSYHAWLGSDERAAPGTVPGGRPWDWSTGAFGRWNPATYRYLTPPGDARLDLGTAEWIATFQRHVGGGPALLGQGGSPLTTRRASSGVDPDMYVAESDGQPKAWDWQRSGTVEMNCFLCHTSRPDNQARTNELRRGRFQWANTATLAATRVVAPSADGWSYDRALFLPDGRLDAARLGLREPTSENCAVCHGLAARGEQPVKLELSLAQWSTATKGQVFSPQRISESADNLRDKEHLSRAWDVHAERLMQCTSCHYSINNPAFYEPTLRMKPGHLKFEPRRLTPGQYIEQPSHQFAKGHASQGTVARHLDGTMRRCDDCHNSDHGHDWLPYREAHFARLSCEACHIPQVHAPAVRQIDWTLPTPSGEPRIEWRGIEGDDRSTAEITGFRPVLLPREGLDGRTRLVPHNLIAAWYWVEGGPKPRPVRMADLKAAILQDKDYHPDVARALGSGPGVLDSPEKVEAVRRRLEQVGIVEPHIEAEVQPYSLHHGVGPAKSAVRQCETCHRQDSRLSERFILASYMPGGVRPELMGDSGTRLAGHCETDREGRLLYEPSTREASLYVLGHDRWSWVSALGALSLFSVALGVVVHAGIRISVGRKKMPRPGPPADSDLREESAP